METYKCKTCGAEFPKPQAKDSYLAHCRSCAKTAKNRGVETLPLGEVSAKGAINLTEEKVETPQTEVKVKVKANEQKIAEAKKFSTCRGDYENNKAEICKRYGRCTDCWNDLV